MNLRTCGLSALLAIGLSVLLTSSAEAQEFRIYTAVYKQNPNAAAEQPAKSTPVTRSLTLFHAGKVYDYIDSMREVIIFEPANRRFTILSIDRSLSTTVDFEELNHLLKMSRKETNDYIGKLQKDKTEANQRVAKALAFQLDPVFQKQFDGESKELSMRSDYFQYRIKLAEVQTPEVVEKYLTYADWMARLNHTLHPQALYPQPRIVLNNEIRKTGMMPIGVDLHANFDIRIHLRAEHKISWALDSKDRALIHQWEKMLQGREVTRKTFKAYQQAVLGVGTRKGD